VIIASTRRKSNLFVGGTAIHGPVKTKRVILFLRGYGKVFMWLRCKAYLKKFDWILFFSVFLLIFLGLSAIYGVNLGSEDLDFVNFKKQVIFVIVGTGVLFGVSLLDYRIFQNYSRFLYVMGFILLVTVLFLGQEIRGTKGWFVFGPLYFQPVELVKIIGIIFIARYFTEWARFMNCFRHILISGIGVFIFVFLVLLQPEFGSAIVMFFIWFFMILIVGIRKTHLIFMLVVFLVMGSFMWLFFLKDYQKDRLTTFLKPMEDPLGKGYNITQSMIAVGGGGWIGEGLGSGSQTRLKFLPESQTDFIFAVLAEELGFLGVGLILFLFALIFYRIARVARRVEDDFALFLVLSIMVALAIQVTVNVGMNVGVMPVTGISLPFISYGGSYLIVSLAMIGMVEGVWVQSR